MDSNESGGRNGGQRSKCRPGAPTIYVYSYAYKGERYHFEIPAETDDEATERLDAIQYGAVRFEGELVAKIPAITGAWLPSLIVRLRNWMRG